MKKENKSPIADGLSERSAVPGVSGTEHDRYGANQTPKKQSEKAKRGGSSFTIK